MDWAGISNSANSVQVGTKTSNTVYYSVAAAQATSCPCGLRNDIVASDRNFCFYPANRAGCPMVAPGGYCDGDRNQFNGFLVGSQTDWVRGWTEYHNQCGQAAGATPNTSQSGLASVLDSLESSLRGLQSLIAQ